MKLARGNHDFKGLKLDTIVELEIPHVYFGDITGTAGETTCTISNETGNFNLALNRVLIHGKESIGFRDNYREGEINKIVSRVGNTIMLERPLQADYAEAKIWGREDVTMELSNLEVDTVDDNNGIILGGFTELKLNNVSGKGNDVGIAIRRCENVEIIDCEGYDGGVLIGLNYGISITNSSNVVLRGGKYDGVRHGITTGGGVEPNPICRNIEIDGAIAYGTVNVGAIDFHGNIDGGLVHHCTAFGGLKVAGRNGHWHHNNSIIRVEDNYPNVYSAEWLNFNHIIEDNTFEHYGEVPSSRAAFVDVGGNNLPVTEQTQGGTLIIRNNTMTTETAQDRGIRIVNRGSTAELSVELLNNQYTDVVPNTEVLIQTISGSDIQLVELDDPNEP